eukprot:s6758_g2.t1
MLKAISPGPRSLPATVVSLQESPSPPGDATLLPTCGASATGIDHGVKANVDYSRFQRLVDAEDAKEQAECLSVAVCGRRGWNAEVVNGIYRQDALEDGWLNGRPRLRKRDGTRWLKFNDSKQWMISRFSDGRPLGEAFASDDSQDPGGIRELWHVCCEAKTWEEDDQISVTSGQCQGCGKSLLRALRCGQCRAVSYCSSSCQKADWRYHKRRCCRPAVAVPAAGEEGRHRDAGGPEEVFSSREIPTPCAPSAPSPATCRQRSSPLPSGSVGPGSWEEIDLTVWARRRLEILLGGPEELEGLPEMRVRCGDVGGLEVVGVKEVEGLASVWPNPGGVRCHLFDLSFQVVFKATWLGDFGLVSMEGLVFCDDFTSNLVSDPEAACGMMVDFAHSVDSFLEVSGPQICVTTEAVET